MYPRLPVRGLCFDVLRPTVAGRRIYRTFTYREAVLRIYCSAFDTVTAEVVRQRHILEAYIERHPEFRSSLKPVSLHDNAPEVARRMAQAAFRIGVGPMAAVAGAMAQCAAEAALTAGAEEVIVENGGDIYLNTTSPVTIGLDAGEAKLGRRLALAIEPEQTPIAICSSSGKMGHSMSLGQCDLATVVAKDAALADAAATEAANLIQTADDVNPTLERISSIEGIDGVFIVKDDRVGLAGRLPPLVKTSKGKA